MFPGALAHNYQHFPLLNIRLYSLVGSLIESAQVIRRRVFSCHCCQFFWPKTSEALCAIDYKSQRRSLPQQWQDKRWNETTDAILGQYEIEISQLYCNKVTEVEWWSHIGELLQGKVLSGRLVRPLANVGTKTKVTRWRAITHRFKSHVKDSILLWKSTAQSWNPNQFSLRSVLVKLIILIITFQFGFWSKNTVKRFYKAT